MKRIACGPLQNHARHPGRNAAEHGVVDGLVDGPVEREVSRCSLAANDYASPKADPIGNIDQHIERSVQVITTN